MHPTVSDKFKALNQPAVQLRILQVLQKQPIHWADGRRRNALVAMTLTCRTFCEIGLNLAWQNIQIGALLKIWTRGGVLQHDWDNGYVRCSGIPGFGPRLTSSQSFLREPTEADWGRLNSTHGGLRI